MNLNLHILKEDLKQWHFEGTPIGAPTQRTCAYPVPCRKLPEVTQKEELYILRADGLPEEAVCANVICIGQPPEQWLDGNYNILYTAENVDEYELMSHINHRFHVYERWAQRLQEAVDLELPFQAFAERSVEVNPNPVYIQGPLFRVLCNYIPPMETESDLYKHYQEAYMPGVGFTLTAEEINLLISDQEYNDAIHDTEPNITTGKHYGYRSLYYNIWEEETVLARILFDEIISPVTGKDYAIIEIFGSYIKKRLLASDIYSYERSAEMERILQKLLSHTLLPEEKIIGFLDELQWNVDDAYVCFYLQLKAKNNTALAPLALRLSQLIMQECYTVYNDAIVFVCNLTQMNTTRDKLFSQILPFLRDNLLTAGISTTYRNFKNLYYYYHQAIIAAEYGAKKHPTHWYFKFEEQQLEYMIRKCVEKTIPDILIPEGLRTLMEYDRERGLNYTQTLKIYLRHDRCITDTIRAAFMHRSTFAYQIKRIEEIIQMDLDDPDVRLLLLMIFRILDEQIDSA